MTTDELSALRSWVIAQTQYEFAYNQDVGPRALEHFSRTADERWEKVLKMATDTPLARELVTELDREDE